MVKNGIKRGSGSTIWYDLAPQKVNPSKDGPNYPEIVSRAGPIGSLTYGPSTLANMSPCENESKTVRVHGSTTLTLKLAEAVKRTVSVNSASIGTNILAAITMVY